MRDSIGGVVNIMFIGVFLLVVSAYLALSVSYNKAFRVKNKIIKILEQNKALNDTAKSEIDKQMKSIGYNSNENLKASCDETYKYHCEKGYCVAWVSNNDDLNSGYFRVTTSILINIPILNRISGIKLFTVSGDTITLYPENEPEIVPNC